MEAPQTPGSKVFTAAGVYFIQMSLSCVLSVTQAEACVEDWQTFQFAANLNSFPSSFQLSLSLIPVPSESLPPASRVLRRKPRFAGREEKLILSSDKTFFASGINNKHLISSERSRVVCMMSGGVIGRKMLVSFY